jgi:hypothetical protein
MRLSNNQFRVSQQCEYRWFVEYVLGRKKLESAPSHSQMIGTIFHKIAEYYLKEGAAIADGNAGAHELSTIDLMLEAYRSVHEEYTAQYPFLAVEDIEQARHSAFNMWSFYLPRSPWFSSKYRVIDVPDAKRFQYYEFGGKTYEFEYRPDAEYLDVETGQRFLVDFKTTSNVSPEGFGYEFQLPFYAWLTHTATGEYVHCAYVFFKSVLPKEPELSKKDNMPLTGKESYATTWEYWSEAVTRLGINAEDYREVMQPKMHPVESFYTEFVSYMTPETLEFVEDTVRGHLERFERITQTTGVMRNDREVCAYCPLNALCSDIRMNGKRPTQSDDLLFSVHNIPMKGDTR